MSLNDKPTKQELLDELHKMAQNASTYVTRLEAYRLIAEIEGLVPVRHAVPPPPTPK